MSKFFSHFLFVLFIIFFFACTSSAPPPTENELIKIYTEHESAINSLLDNPDNPARKAGLGVKSIHILPADSRVVHFSFWSKDFFGPGGASKGLAYLEKVPKTLVSSVDNNPDVKPPNQGIFYRRINENWYVFYQSTD